MNQVYLLSRRLLVFLLAIGLSFHVAAQNVTVTGKVTSADDGTGVPGANVLEKGTTNGVITDADGNYSINVPSGATLVVSFIGYISQEIAIDGKTSINVSLETDVQQLSEVVVVGYGTQEKKEITSSVASISSAEFNQGNISDPSQLLQGKVSGLSIVRAGGDPNGSFNIRLRGLSTFGANSQPLVVIDGVIGASLDSVDPNDIETIDVLKDGSAAAIYGTRGSSGVILVTTKVGVPGRVNIDYNGFVNVESVANSPSILSGSEYVGIGGTDLGSNTDWFDELTQNGISHTHGLSLSGGSENTRYRISLNYRDRESVAIGHGFNRINTRLNLSQSMFDDKLRLQANLTASNKTTELVPLAAFRYATIYNPTSPIFDPDPNSTSAQANNGYFQQTLFDYYNPIAMINQIKAEEELKNYTINFKADYEIIPGLIASAQYSEFRENFIGRGYASKFDAFLGAGSNGLAGQSTSNKLNQLFESTVNWTKEFDAFELTALGGYSWQEFTDDGFGVQVADFLFDQVTFNDLDAGLVNRGGQASVSSFKQQSKLVAFFGRVNLNFSNTYFVSASLRREGSSTFGENNKWASFPAVSAGVELTRLIDMPFANSLKFRVSYGQTGNLPVSPGLSQAQFGNVGVVTLPDGRTLTSYAPIANENPDLSWETKKEINVGFDFSLFDERFNGSIEYYDRSTEDLLFFSPVPVPPNRFPFKWLNLGQIENSGFEFYGSYNAIDNGSFTWTPALNFTFYNSSILTSLSNDEVSNSEFFVSTPGSPGQNDDLIHRVAEGERIGDMWGPVFEGVDESGGYVFANGGEEQVVGNGLPDFEIGINNTLTYKNFDFNFFLRGVFGHDLYNTYRGFYETRDPASISSYNRVTTDLTDENITAVSTFSSLYVEDASFLRLDNATVGYTLNLPEGSNIRKLRFYISGQNLFTITDYTGIDPEVRYADTGRQLTNDLRARGEFDAAPNALGPGIERRNTFFTTRSFTFGVNLGL